MNPADNLFNLLIVETLAIHLVQQAFMTAIKDLGNPRLQPLR
jgi:hypothetical protein